MTSPNPTFPTSPGQVIDQAQHGAAQVTEQVKQQATSQLESRKDRAVDSLVTVAQALRQTGQHLHEQHQDSIAGYVDQAAQRVENLTNHVRVRDVPQLVDETEDLARRNPAVFLGAAVALGFVGARFLMSSGRRARAQRTYGLPGQAFGSGLEYAPAGYGNGQSSPAYAQPAYAQSSSANAQPGAPYGQPGAPTTGGIDGAPGTPVA